jgi:Ras-related protein Rab-5C
MSQLSIFVNLATSPHLLMGADAPVRVVLIGDASVGKTSIVKRFLDGQYDPTEFATIGAGYFNNYQTIRGESVPVEIWDTAGQEKYRSLAPLYYRGAAGAIAVFDVTNPQTCDNLTWWIAEFKKAAGNEAVIAISGNKADLLAAADEPANSGDKVGSPTAADEAMAKAESLALNSNYIFEQTSAQTGQGIRGLFDRFLSEAVVRVMARQGPVRPVLLVMESPDPCSC